MSYSWETLHATARTCGALCNLPPGVVHIDRVSALAQVLHDLTVLHGAACLPQPCALAQELTREERLQLLHDATCPYHDASSG